MNISKPFKRQPAITPPTIRDQIASLANRLAEHAQQEDPEKVLQRIEDRHTIRDRAEFLKRALERHTSILRSEIIANNKTPRRELQDRTMAILAAVDDGDYAAIKDYGLDMDHAWIRDILSSSIQNKLPAELSIYTASPTSQLDLRTGELHLNPSALQPQGRVGVKLGLLFKELNKVVHNMRLNIVVNDYWESASHRELTSQERQQYILALSGSLEQQGIIGDEDRNGLDFNMFRESDQLIKLDTLLMARLRKSQSGKLSLDTNGNVYFKPSHDLLEVMEGISPARRREFAGLGILIKDSEGSPTAAALDAASYTDALNNYLMHLVCTDIRHKEEQEATFVLLRATNIIKRERHHKIYFDSEKLSPELVTYAVGKLMQQEVDKLLRSAELYDDWGAFDNQEYAERNYGVMLPEDRKIIRSAVRSLQQLGIQPGSLQRVADVGSGPNLYPAMIASPYVAEGATLDLLEFSPNRTYLADVIAGTIDADKAALWRKYEKLMIEFGGDLYEGCENEAKRKSKVQFGDIFSLPEAEYDLITSYFVAESVVDSEMPFREAIHSLARALKADGMMLVAHVVGSEGYHAGVGTHFPAVNLSVEQIKKAYHDANLEVTGVVFSDHPDGEKFREGYDGIVLVIAHPRLRGNS
jgi:hypothetical protein